MFIPLVLDRDALYHLSAGDGRVAAERYAALWARVENASGPEAGRNRLTTQLGWAAALLSTGAPVEALQHIAVAERLLAGAGVPARLAGPYGRGVTATPPADYGLLLAGMRAQAHAGAGQLVEAAAAMTRRRDGLAARVARDQLDEDRLALAMCEAQLGLYAYRRHAFDEARDHIEAALRQWDAWSESTGTAVEDTGLALLAAYAELHLFGGLPLERLRLDLPRRLGASYAQLNQLRNPAWEPMRERLEVYVTMMNLGRSR
jgi:hypothetical protein